MQLDIFFRTQFPRFGFMGCTFSCWALGLGHFVDYSWSFFCFRLSACWVGRLQSLLYIYKLGFSSTVFEHCDYVR